MPLNLKPQDFSEYVQETFHKIAPVFKNQLDGVFTQDADIVTNGENLADILTKADLKSQGMILDGSDEDGFAGLRQDLPYSVSEEDTDEKRGEARANAKTIWMLDPLDGTGDLKKKNIAPTVLLTLLHREELNRLFNAVGTIIIDPIGRIAIISDGEYVKGFDYSGNGDAQDMELEWIFGKQIMGMHYPERTTYPQHNFQEFKLWLQNEKNIPLKNIPIGGAGRAILQLIRGIYKPQKTKNMGLGTKYYDALLPIDMIMNYQPDHKLWDRRPLQVLAKASHLPTGVDGYGNKITHNEARANTKKDMHLRNGYLQGHSSHQQERIRTYAKEFEAETGKKLTDINY